MRFDLARRAYDDAWLVWTENTDPNHNALWTIFAVCADRAKAVAVIEATRKAKRPVAA